MTRIIRSKKICFIVSTPMTATVFLLGHMEALSKYYDVWIVANFAGDNAFEYSFLSSKKNIAINREINIFKDFKSLLKLIIFLKTERFDVVHTVTPKAGLLGILAAKLVGVENRIHTFTGQVWFTKKFIFKHILKLADVLTFKLASYVLVDGNSQRSFLIEQKIILEEKSKVLGAGSICGVNQKKFHFCFETRCHIREYLGIDEDTVVFGYLGRLSRDKGLCDLGNAFRKLHNIYSNSKLILIGPDEDGIKNEIESDFGTDGIIFLGSVTEPARYMHSFDIFCMPSYREGFGTSVIEASSLGLPIICSDTYGLFDAVIDGETGFRFKVGSVDELYEKMNLLFSNDELRKSLGNNGKKYVVENFLSDSITEEWKNFYLNLLK